jgi:hypothetical protein
MTDVITSAVLLRAQSNILLEILVPFHTKYGMVVPGTYREGVSLMFVLLNRKLFFLYKNTMMIYVITEQSFKEENLDKFRYCCF